MKDTNTGCPDSLSLGYLEIDKNGQDRVNTYTSRGKKKKKSVSEYVADLNV